MLNNIKFDDGLSVKTQLLNIHSYPIHNHKDFQIFFMLEGELSLKLHCAKYILHPGSIHIIHVDDVHSIESITDDNLVLVLSFNCDYFQKIFPHFSSTVFITNIEEGSFENRDVLCTQMFKIVAETYNKSDGFIQRINDDAVALINILMKNFRGFVIDLSGKAFVHKTSHDYIQVDRISRIIQYVYENYPYKISLTEIASKEHISPYYLSHVFHKLVGVNFRDFLCMVRVEMSEPSVLATKKSITQIAQDMGFSDTKYYSQHFYNYLGCHPKEYRKKYADSIYGIVEPDINEYPISQLKPVISKYTQYPVFKDDFTAVSHIEVDFTACPVCKLPKLSNLLSALDDTSQLAAGEDYSSDFISKLYQNVLPQESAIKILQRMAASPENFQYPEISMFDISSLDNALFTVTGLQKPMYHLLNTLKKLPEDITAYGPNNLVLHEKKSQYLLIFNPSDCDNMTIDIVARNLTANYKLTKYHLLARNSCLNFWAQLNFSNDLTEEDIGNINYMSRPNIAFEIVPQQDQYYTAIDLAPFDIMLLRFSCKG